MSAVLTRPADRAAAAAAADYAVPPSEVTHFVDSIGLYIEDGTHKLEHDVEITGWGETADGDKYWHIRNSWGVYWGEEGWFRLARGIDNLGVESQECSWATPKKNW